jgi:ankyrin repeat protein
VVDTARRQSSFKQQRMSSLEEFAKAIESGDSRTVGAFISSGAVDVNAHLPRPFSPPALVHAAKCGQKQIVEILLRADARVNDVDKGGRTAFHAAADSGHHDVLALLLARQPNLAAFDKHGKTALCLAVSHCENDDGRCALMLLAAGAPNAWVGRDDLCAFAATSTAAIQALIDRGVDLRELFGSNRVSPLHSAALGTRDADVFDMLTDVCGLDLEARDDDGQTCIHFAADGGNDVALRWLVEAGADVTVAANDGSTPLHGVTDDDFAILLLAAGASAGARDNSGRTPLHLAANEPDWRVVRPLLANPADLDVADDDGNTARQLLARRGVSINPNQVKAARRGIARARIDFVRERALEVCIGLQSLELDALQMCEILLFACGRVAPLIPFHVWWAIATAVKHFQKK